MYQPIRMIQVSSSKITLVQRLLSKRKDLLLNNSNKWNIVQCMYARPISTTLCRCESSQLSENVKAEAGALTTGQKVKQAGKDASYMGVMLLGFGITGTLIWYVASELLFGFSPSSVYSKALKMVKKDERIQYEIGDGLKGYGEETSRGRRRHVSSQEYVVDGVNHMRIQFYVSGTNRKGTVHADAVETSRGNFEFRYVFVELQGFPPSDPIIIVDNR